MGLFHKETGTEVLLKYLGERFKRNKTSTMAISGSLGSGKSYTSLRIGEIWYKHFFDEKFPIKNCCFSIKDMMARFNSGELRKGDLLILEETGIAISSKNFMSKINKFFNYYMQGFRSKQILIIFNLPVFSLMDKSTRILINANFVTLAIDKKKKLCEVKPLFHQLNQQTAKIYPKYLRRGIRRGKYTFKEKVKLFRFKIPSKELVQVYEKKKDKFVTNLGLEISRELEKANKKEKVTYPHTCNRCSYKWEGLKKIPQKCPECNTKHWNKPQIEPDPLGKPPNNDDKPYIPPI